MCGKGNRNHFNTLEFFNFLNIIVGMATSWLKASYIVRIAYFILFLLNCVHYVKYIPDPQKDIEKWVKNFTQQRSFSYEYEMKTQTARVKAKGDCIIDWAEHIRGLWNYSETELDFEYIGIGDIEWTKKDGKWQESARGEESNIFTQVERMLDFDKFEYINSAQGFNYQFKANVPFLAPDKWKEMTGWLEISKKNFLPKFIWAGLPDSSVYWQVNISNYNHPKNISPPITKWQDYAIKSESTLIMPYLLKKIKNRLNLVNINYRIKISDSLIILTIPGQYNIDDLKAMLTTGNVAVYGLTENREEAMKIGYLKDDPAQPLFLTTKLMDSDDIKDARIKFDDISRPYILISLNKRLNLPQEFCFEIDRVFIGTVLLDKPQKMDKIIFYITNMEYYPLNILKAGLIQPLPVIEIEPIFKGTD